MKTQESRTQKTVNFDQELDPEGAATRQAGVTRRSFMGGMGAMMAAGALAAIGGKSAFADEAEAEAEDAEAEEAEAAATEEEAAAEDEAAASDDAEESGASAFETLSIESTSGWTGTPEDVLALGVSTMPLDDLNAYRKAYLDVQTDYTCEDGTVVPAVFVKVHALTNTYGFGCRNTPADECFDEILKAFTEDDAQAYIDMPMGVEFTPYEMAAEEGRTVEECEEICQRLAAAGYLSASSHNRGEVYHQVPPVFGSAEARCFNSIIDDGVPISMPVTVEDMAVAGTPSLYYVPVDASVTSDGTILPYDDLKEKVKYANTVAIAPCICRYMAMVAAYGVDNIPSVEDFLTGEYEDYFSEVCNQRVETCIVTGDEAEYWIEQGYARQITGEQAADYLQRSIDDGFMLESSFEKNSEVICSCHVDSCGLTQLWMSLGDAEDIASCNAFQQISHYTLEVDTDLCIACGTCVDRCPLHIITINDEGWAEPGVDCFRCGQCAYVCPQNARHLVQRDESELAPMPTDILDQANVMGAYRFETGLITL